MSTGFIKKLKLRSIVQQTDTINFRIKYKSFQLSPSNQSIYTASNIILSSLSHLHYLIVVFLMKNKNDLEKIF